MIKLNVHTQCHFSVSPLPSLRSKSLTFLALAITIVWSAQNDAVSPNNKNSQYILSVHYVQSTLTTALYHYLIKPPNNLKVLIISLFYRWRKKTQKGQVTEWYHRARKWHTQNSSPSRQTSITNTISLLKFINVPQRTELNSFHSLTTLSTILSWPTCPAPSLLSTSFSMLQAHWSSVPGSLIL